MPPSTSSSGKIGATKAHKRQLSPTTTSKNEGTSPTRKRQRKEHDPEEWYVLPDKSAEDEVKLLQLQGEFGPVSQLKVMKEQRKIAEDAEKLVAEARASRLAAQNLSLSVSPSLSAPSSSAPSSSAPSSSAPALSDPSSSAPPSSAPPSSAPSSSPSSSTKSSSERTTPSLLNGLAGIIGQLRSTHPKIVELLEYEHQQDKTGEHQKELSGPPAPDVSDTNFEKQLKRATLKLRVFSARVEEVREKRGIKRQESGMNFLSADLGAEETIAEMAKGVAHLERLLATLPIEEKATEV
ncbi:unnamed protein product [Zymoseptoria tritici ST99CH_1A5]|uniref:Uncharacterized protein n=1 Tax=Zymoseptoria tritici ST99CH_1A5 TaxID=1276529 RepID=A0A1Y6LX06_ZYMTR|nr:unnamed protein product [Zymoseptoria tritici ST99CH_1A5]